MDKAEQTENCAHSECNCMVERAGEYCSDYCQNAGATGDDGCKCGHPECEYK